MSQTRQYELVYILPPDATEQQVAELHDAGRGSRRAHARHRSRRPRTGAARKLAYEIGHHKEGVYVLEVINGSRRADEGARSPAEGDRPGHPPPRRPRGRGEEGRRPHAHQAPDRVASAAASSAACRRSASRARAASADSDDDRTTIGSTGWRFRHAIRTRTIGRRRPRPRRRQEDRRQGKGPAPRRCSAAARSASSARTRSTTSTTRTSSCSAPFVPERGKILPRRISGTCAMHQRKLQTAIKRARQLALIPYVTE